MGGDNSKVHRILVMNSKGGCGKTTLATNLAAYYAHHQFDTALIDHDPQACSMKWLSLRSRERPAIHGIPAYRRPASGVTQSWHMRTPPGTERVIVDAPAGVMGLALQSLIRQVDTVVVPVLPSPIDIHAATRFIEDLLLVGKVRSFGVHVGVVANRVRKNTLVYQSLERFLNTLNLPFLTSLRDTQTYVRAADRGVGIHEMWDQRAEQDRREWRALIDWLESRSLHGRMLPRQHNVNLLGHSS